MEGFLVGKVRYYWEIYIQGENMYIELNGGINSILDMTHEAFEKNKKEKRSEIEFYQDFTITDVKGAHLIGI